MAGGLVLLFAACGSNAEKVAAPDCAIVAGIDAVTVDGVTADGAPGDAATTDDGAADSGDVLATLDPCLVACDRAIDCAVIDCKGYTWASSGPLYVDCVTSCDKQPLALNANSNCKDASVALADAVPTFSALCSSNPCQQACAKLTGCVVSECEKVDAAAGPGIEADCLKTCTPQTSAWVNGGATCNALIEGIASNDAAFASNCHGAGTTPTTCATQAQCAPYGNKLTGCLLKNCSAAAKPYETGLQTALTAFCAGDAKCPTPAVVASIVAPTTTCASPGLAQFGKAAPFKRICDGTVGASATEIASACTGLMTCPNTDWLVSKDVCLVLFGMRDDAATRIPCLNAATDCAARGACLQGF